MAYYRPQRELRQAALQPPTAALLFIDVQQYNCAMSGALYGGLSSEELQGPEYSYFFERVAYCSPRWQQLQQLCRSAGVQVMYTVIQSLTQDGRDRGLDYRISGFHVPPGCWDAQVLEAIRPGPDEMVLPKSSSSVFLSTSLDYTLRSMGVRQLLLCGCVTDQCVEHAVRDACDLGYLVTLVTDCCATYSQQRHDNSLAAVQGYCRQRTVQQVQEELQQLVGSQQQQQQQQRQRQRQRQQQQDSRVEQL